MIFASTPLDVAKAQLHAWQRNKELAFLAELERLIQTHNKRGLERKRIARVIAAAAKGLEKVGR